jgi:ribulose-phosphate 3-epimerase
MPVPHERKRELQWERRGETGALDPRGRFRPRAGADRIHVDVMDGHFVPNLSMGALVVRSLRRVTRLPLEAHLMISNPDLFVDEFAQAGTDSFLVHWEGNNDLSRTVQRIKALRKGVGVAINSATSAAVLEEILPDLDQILVMTVNPGFGHQHFLPTTLPKITRVREMIDRHEPRFRKLLAHTATRYVDDPRQITKYLRRVPRYGWRSARLLPRGARGPTTRRRIADGVFQRSISCCVEADTKPRETAADRGPLLCVIFSDSAGEDQQIDPIEGGDHCCHLFSN